MGRDKAFLEINGTTFIQNAVDILKPVCAARIKIVLNPDRTDPVSKLPTKIASIFDLHKTRGPLGGIHAALNDCQTEFAIILAVDQPLVSGALIADLADHALRSGPDVVIPQSESGDFKQLCTVYNVESSFRLLDKLLSDDTTSVSVLRFIEALEDREVFSLEGHASDFENINNPEDYDRIKS